MPHGPTVMAERMISFSSPSNSQNLPSSDCQCVMVSSPCGTQSIEADRRAEGCQCVSPANGGPRAAPVVTTLPVARGNRERRGLTRPNNLTSISSDLSREDDLLSAAARDVALAGVGEEQAEGASNPSNDAIMVTRIAGPGDSYPPAPAPAPPISTEAVIMPDAPSGGIRAVQFGAPGSLSFRMLYLDASDQIVSPWHHIPVFFPDGKHIRVVCTAPAGTQMSHELSPSESLNPLRVARRQRQGRSQGGEVSPRNDLNAQAAASAATAASHATTKLWNIGDLTPFETTVDDAQSDALDSSPKGESAIPMCFREATKWTCGVLPQTWLNPEGESDGDAIDFSFLPGTGLPVEVVDLSSLPVRLGQMYSAKVVGAVPVAREEGLSWTVIAIAAGDPMAKMVRHVEELEWMRPGELALLQTWLETRDMVHPGDRAANVLHSMTAYGPDKAFAIIGCANTSWQRMHCTASPRSPSLSHLPSRPRRRDRQHTRSTLSTISTLSSSFDECISLCEDDADVAALLPAASRATVVSRDAPVALGPMPATPAGLKALWECYGPDRLSLYGQVGEAKLDDWQGSGQERKSEPVPLAAVGKCQSERRAERRTRHMPSASARLSQDNLPVPPIEAPHSAWHQVASASPCSHSSVDSFSFTAVALGHLSGTEGGINTGGRNSADGGSCRQLQGSFGHWSNQERASPGAVVSKSITGGDTGGNGNRNFPAADQKGQQCAWQPRQPASPSDASRSMQLMVHRGVVTPRRGQVLGVRVRGDGREGWVQAGGQGRGGWALAGTKQQGGTGSPAGQGVQQERQREKQQQQQQHLGCVPRSAFSFPPRQAVGSPGSPELTWQGASPPATAAAAAAAAGSGGQGGSSSGQVGINRRRNNSNGGGGVSSTAALNDRSASATPPMSGRPRLDRQHGGRRPEALSIPSRSWTELARQFHGNERGGNMLPGSARLPAGHSSTVHGASGFGAGHKHRLLPPVPLTGAVTGGGAPSHRLLRKAHTEGDTGLVRYNSLPPLSPAIRASSLAQINNRMEGLLARGQAEARANELLTGAAAEGERGGDRERAREKGWGSPGTASPSGHRGRSPAASDAGAAAHSRGRAKSQQPGYRTRGMAMSPPVPSPACNSPSLSTPSPLSRDGYRTHVYPSPSLSPSPSPSPPSGTPLPTQPPPMARQSLTAHPSRVMNLHVLVPSRSLPGTGRAAERSPRLVGISEDEVTQGSDGDGNQRDGAARHQRLLSQSSGYSVDTQGEGKRGVGEQGGSALTQWTRLTRHQSDVSERLSQHGWGPKPLGSPIGSSHNPRGTTRGNEGDERTSSRLEGHGSKGGDRDALPRRLKIERQGRKGGDADCVRRASLSPPSAAVACCSPSGAVTRSGHPHAWEMSRGVRGSGSGMDEQHAALPFVQTRSLTSPGGPRSPAELPAKGLGFRMTPSSSLSPHKQQQGVQQRVGVLPPKSPRGGAGLLSLVSGKRMGDSPGEGGRTGRRGIERGKSPHGGSFRERWARMLDRTLSLGKERAERGEEGEKGEKGGEKEGLKGPRNMARAATWQDSLPSRDSHDVKDGAGGSTRLAESIPAAFPRSRSNDFDNEGVEVVALGRGERVRGGNALARTRSEDVGRLAGRERSRPVEITLSLQSHKPGEEIEVIMEVEDGDSDVERSAGATCFIARQPKGMRVLM